MSSDFWSGWDGMNARKKWSLEDHRHNVIDFLPPYSYYEDFKSNVIDSRVWPLMSPQE
jgi:hypothetical protein